MEDNGGKDHKMLVYHGNFMVFPGYQMIKYDEICKSLGEHEEVLGGPSAGPANRGTPIS